MCFPGKELHDSLTTTTTTTCHPNPRPPARTHINATFLFCELIKILPDGHWAGKMDGWLDSLVISKNIYIYIKVKNYMQHFTKVKNYM